MNVYHWFLSLKRHHDTDVEQVLKTEFIVVMFFCCTFVKLSFFFIFLCSFLGRWTMLPYLASDFIGRRGRNMEDVAPWSVKLQIWAGRKIRLGEQYTFPKAFVVYAAVSNINRCCYSLMSQVLGSALLKLCTRCSAKNTPQEEGL